MPLAFMPSLGAGDWYQLEQARRGHGKVRAKEEGKGRAGGMRRRQRRDWGRKRSVIFSGVGNKTHPVKKAQVSPQHRKG